jgi:quinoprotein glucose dehydrogenase
MAGGGPLVTKTLLIVNSGGRDVAGMEEVAATITAYDKDTGEYLGSVELPSTPWGNPITYLHGGKQHILVAVGGRPGAVPELIALALP